MRRAKRLALFLVFSGLLGSHLCLAAETMQQQTAQATTMPAYVSGGIGEDDPIKGTKQNYNLRLLFANKGGAYLADVRVAVRNAQGTKVLEAESPGPLFYARLAPGSYRVTAEFAGKAQSKSADLRGGRHQDLRFYWD